MSHPFQRGVGGPWWVIQKGGQGRRGAPPITTKGRGWGGGSCGPSKHSISSDGFDIKKMGAKWVPYYSRLSTPNTYIRLFSLVTMKTVANGWFLTSSLVLLQASDIIVFRHKKWYIFLSCITHFMPSLCLQVSRNLRISSILSNALWSVKLGRLMRWLFI